MHEIVSGTERRRKMEAQYTQAGGIIWSPDGKTLMLTLAANPCDSANWVQSVVRLDATMSSQAMLIRDDKRLFITTEWPEANQVLLKDKDGNLWSMNATTGKLEQMQR